MLISRRLNVMDVDKMSVVNINLSRVSRATTHLS